MLTPCLHPHLHHHLSFHHTLVKSTSLPTQHPPLKVVRENRAMVTDLTANLRQQPSGGPVMLPGTHAACPRPFSTASSFPKPLTHPPTFSLSADDLASCFTGKLNQTEENPIEPQYHMDLPNAAPTHSDPLPGIRGILCALKPQGRQSPHLREDIVSAICHVSSAFYFLLPIPRHVS